MHTTVVTRRYPRVNPRKAAVRRALDSLTYALAASGIAVTECPMNDGTVTVDYLLGFGPESESIGSALIKARRPPDFHWATYCDQESLIVSHAHLYATWVS
jgi:hypothetical protein